MHPPAGLAITAAQAWAMFSSNRTPSVACRNSADPAATSEANGDCADTYCMSQILSCV